MTNTMELVGKVCLVTGGTSGIGAMTALAFATRGAHVAVVGRNPRKDPLEMLQAVAATHGAEAIYIQADIGNVEDCARTVAEMCTLWGRVDVLVHAAGASVPG